MSMKAFSPFPWNHRPAQPYLGPPLPKNGDHGSAVPKFGWRWTVARQAWAVRQGFFVQRCSVVPYNMGFGTFDYNMQRPVIHSMTDCWRYPHIKYEVEHPAWHKIEWRKGEETMRTIIRHARDGDLEYLYLLNFITQQDEHGYHGAWDEPVIAWNSTLAWFKHYVAEHKVPPTPFYQKRLEALQAKRDNMILVGSGQKKKPKPWMSAEFKGNITLTEDEALKDLDYDPNAEPRQRLIERQLSLSARDAVEQRRKRLGW